MDDKTAKANAATLPRTVVETVPSSAKLAKLLDQLDAVLSAVQEEADIAIMNGALGGSRAFVVLHRLNEKIDTFCKRFSAHYDKCKTETLPSIIADSGQKHIALTEGFRIGVSFRLYASIREGKREEAHDWLRKNALGDLIQQTVNSSTLSAAVKHMREEDNTDVPETLFNVVDKANVSVTRVK